MKHTVDILRAHDIVIPKLTPLNNKDLGIRKKVTLYKGVDVNASYVLIIRVFQKSRFLRKNVLEIETILRQTKAKLGHNFKKKIILIQAPLCSKAEFELKEHGWRVILDTI